MTIKLTDKPMISFLDELASSAPAPGGGSVAALSGALGAGLISMVCNLTIGKPKYAAVQDEISALLKKSEGFRQELTGLLEQDVQAYTRLSQTMKLPRDTEEQKTARAALMDKALKSATDVPLRIAEMCVAVIDICPLVAEKGNTSAVSDVGVAVLMAEAGLRGAALNVLINLRLIKDERFVNDCREKLNTLLKDKPETRDGIYNLVMSKL